MKERRLWKEAVAKKVRILVDDQVMSPKQAEHWAHEEYKSLPKCYNCAKILDGDLHTHRLSDTRQFCSESCSDKDYMEEVEKMKRKSTTSDPYPTIGMGATIQVGSDRYSATIIQVSQSGNRIVIQEDNATRVDNNSMSEYQEYTYEANPNGTIRIATLRKDGRYRVSGGKTPVSIGYRNKYCDYPL